VLPSIAIVFQLSKLAVVMLPKVSFEYTKCTVIVPTWLHMTHGKVDPKCLLGS